MPKKKEESIKPETTQIPAFMQNSSYSFDIMADENENFVDQVGETLAAMFAKSKISPAGFHTADSVKHNMIPFRHFYLQYLFGAYGIPTKVMVEIIGGENIGKTTLCYYFMGGAMLVGVPCSLQETESKPLLPNWAMRALNNSRLVAAKMLKRIGMFTGVHAVDQMAKNHTNWILSQRGMSSSKSTRIVGKDTPLLMVVDTWSKLMSKAESAGVYDWKKKGHENTVEPVEAKGAVKKVAKKAAKKAAKKSVKIKEIGEGSNFGHSKWAQEWCRKLPFLLGDLNSVLIITSHQNDKVDMSATGSFMSAEMGSLYNKTKIGGKAFNQTAAMQLILSRKGILKDGSGRKIGTTVMMRIDKNSYGANNRIIEYDLINDHHSDTDEETQCSISFDRAMADFFANESILGTVVSFKRYTCKDLGVTGVTAEDFSKAFHARPDIIAKVGKLLRIHGYDDTVDQIIKQEEEDDAGKSK